VVARRLLLSRIIRHGEESAIQEYSLGGGGAVAGSARGLKFRVGKVDGTLSKPEVDRLVEEARLKGVQEGMRQAEAKLSAPLNTGLTNLENVLDEVSRYRRELFKEAEVEIIELIRFVAKKIMMKELSLRPELLVEIVQKGLEIVENQKSVSIVYHPQDMTLFQKAKPDFMEKFGSAIELRFVLDHSVPPGTALLKTVSTEVEANVEKMVDQLLAAVEQSKVNDQEVNPEGDSV
jgi:flagellar biosynthesis/type III secretory pathway protein FliH